MKRIYLDHAATTPLLPEAREAMLPWLGSPANPSSLHAEGRAARAAVDNAREVVSGALGCLFGEVVFTSSGTEATNLAILGAALANQDSSRRRVLFSAAEHHCVLNTGPILERLGFEVELVAVDQEGRINVANLVDDDVLLLAAMEGNNELGTFNDVKRLGAQCHEVGALFFCDAVQTFPYGLNVDASKADMVAVSAHKLYGPAGAAALFVRAGTPIRAVTVGGGQERDMRAGTENVAGLAGFAAAASWCLGHPEVQDRKRKARDAFAALLSDSGFVPTVEGANLPGHFHCRYPGIDASTLLIRLDRAGVSASSGAACSSGSIEPSHVLLACGYSELEANEGLRFTFGKDSTIEEAEEAARRVIECKDAVLSARS
ncbi:MAG: cysteine desulfurase [Armatimonadetes bacterium]|nr:cysteine desulfurase [Armatimonadota bacterium]